MMENSPVKRFPVNAKDYKLYEEVGEGVSATVYRALCIPLNEHVAIKVLDLERCNNDLDGIRREVQTMSLTDHPNVVRSHCSFTTDRSLWVVMPYMAGGSCLQIMKSDFPEGLEQPMIATLLREVLKALVYLHAHGHIHRDVKAGNILIDSMGAVKLADFGVSACMFDTGDRQRSRNTFVGTPCWMAPEVMQQLHGYDFKADIWSFGITALELAHGHAPFSKYPPMKVLLMTLQNAPPGLDYERDKKFSKSFKEIVAACLVKDPKKRPTSEKLLKHPFFKHARSSDFIARYILEGLSPLGDRFRMLKEKEANILLQNQALHGDKDHLSQQEYMRGISAWNFNLEDLKKQAALIQDDNNITKREDSDFLNKQDACENLVSSEDKLLVESLCNSISVPLQEERQGSLLNIQSLKISYPLDSPKELEGCIQNGLNGTTACSTKEIHASSVPEPPVLLMKVEDKRLKNLGEDVCEEPSFLSKGRFKVAMADPRVKESANGSVSTLVGKSVGDPSTRDTLLLPSLRCILQQNSMQREQIQRLLKYADQSIGNYREFSNLGIINEHLQAPVGSARERDLQSQITDMHKSIEKLDEELQKLKTKNAQLERQISGLQNK